MKGEETEMKGEEDIFERFYRSFQHIDGHFHVLEQRVPLKEQIAYFKYSDQLRKEVDETADLDYEHYVANLQDDELSGEEKKRILSILALSKQIRAYRLLENYVQHPHPELVNWAYMALMESRIMLESELSGEKHIYISTGLGGKGQKMRFYVLILSFGAMYFIDYQRDVIEKEFGYALPKKDFEVERLTIGDQYVELVFLAPVKTDIKKTLEDVIRECNLYGNFLSEIFTITNVKELSPEEVGQLMKKYGRDKTSR